MAKNKDIPLHDRSRTPTFSLKIDVLDSFKTREYDADKGSSRGSSRNKHKKKTKRASKRKIAKGAPKAPKNFRTEQFGAERIKLNWDDPSDQFLLYTIERRETNLVRDKWAEIKTKHAGDEFVDRNCLSGFRYQYRIYATDPAGRSGRVSRSVRSALASLVAMKKLHNKVQTERESILANTSLCPYARFTQLFDNLCLDKAITVVRQYDAFAVHEHQSRATGVFIQVKPATEELIIKDAFDAFPHVAVIPTYLEQRKLPDEFRDTALVEDLRPVALEEAFTVFNFAGIDLLKRMENYIFITARLKLTNLIISDNNINNECEHNSKEDRAAQAADPYAAQPFRTSGRVGFDTLLKGKVKVFEFAEPTLYEPGTEDSNDAVMDWGTVRITYTEEEKVVRKQFLEDNAAKDRGMVKAMADTAEGYAYPDTTKHPTYTPDGAITEGIAKYAVPSIVTTAAEWDEATPQDAEFTYKIIFEQASEKGRTYIEKYCVDDMTHAEIAQELEGSSDKAAVRRIERLGDKTKAEALTALLEYQPKTRIPEMTAPLLRDAFIQAHKGTVSQ